MDIKPIKTDSDYRAALAEIDSLMSAEPMGPAQPPHRERGTALSIEAPGVDLQTILPPAERGEALRNRG